MSIKTTKLSGFTRKDLSFLIIWFAVSLTLILANFNKPLKLYNGEFDPGSGRTLAACFIHASQGEPILRNSSKLANG